MAGEEHAAAHSKPAEKSELSAGEHSKPAEELEWRDDVGIGTPIYISSAGCPSVATPDDSAVSTICRTRSLPRTDNGESAGRPFRRLCSQEGGSDSVPSSTSPMLAALKGAVVHESTGRHQGQVVEEYKSGPSLLPPALHLDGIKPYVKGAREQRVKGTGTWVDEIGINMPPLRTSSSDDDELCSVQPAGRKPAESEWRDDVGIPVASRALVGPKLAESEWRNDVGISVANPAVSPVANSMRDAPKAPAAASKSGNETAYEDWEELLNSKRCCGVRVTSSVGLACIAVPSALMSAFCG
jgi:hypothetical protein